MTTKQKPKVTVTKKQVESLAYFFSHEFSKSDFEVVWKDGLCALVEIGPYPSDEKQTVTKFVPKGVLWRKIWNATNKIRMQRACQFGKKPETTRQIIGMAF